MAPYATYWNKSVLTWPEAVRKSCAKWPFWGSLVVVGLAVVVVVFGASVVDHDQQGHITQELAGKPTSQRIKKNLRNKIIWIYSCRKFVNRDWWKGCPTINWSKSAGQFTELRTQLRNFAEKLKITENWDFLVEFFFQTAVAVPLFKVFISKIFNVKMIKSK